MVRNGEQLSAADKPAEMALRLHAFYKGKMQVMPKCSIRDFSDFADWFTAVATIKRAREATQLLLAKGLISPAPEDQ